MKKSVLKKCSVLMAAILVLSSVGCGKTDAGSKNNVSNAEPVKSESTANSNESVSDPAEKVLNLVVAMDLEGTRLQTPWYNGDILRMIMWRHLLLADADLEELTPDLCTEYKISDDGLTYSFNMEDNNKWHDGAPITADDVVWSFRTALRTSRIKANFLSSFMNIEGAEEYKAGTTEELSGVTAEGNVVTIRLIKPTGNFLKLLSQFAIMPKHLLEKEDVLELHNSSFFEWPIASGMFKITEFSKGNYVILEPFEEYQGDKPNIQKIIVNFSDNPQAMALDGRNDFFVTNSPSEIKVYQDMDKFNYYNGSESWHRYFICNIKDENGNIANKDFANVNVRRAILHAIDREKLVNTYWPDQAEVLNTGITCDAPNYLRDADTYEYDPDLAKKMLEEEKFDFSKPIRIRYYYKDQTTADFMTAISQYLQNVGIKTDVQMIQGDATNYLYNVKEYEMAYKALATFDMEDWYSEYESSNNSFTKIIGKDGYFDDLINRYKSEMDPAEKDEILIELQTLEQEYLYKLPLYKLYAVNFVNKKIILPEDMKFRGLQFDYDLRLAEWNIQ